MNVISILYIVLGLFMHLFSTIMPAIRGYLLFKRFNYIIKIRTLAEILVIVAAANVIVPFRMLGFFVKTLILKNNYQVPYKTNFAVSTIEQLAEIIIQTIVVLLCIYVIGFDGETNIVFKIILSVIAILTLIILFFWNGLSSFIIKIINTCVWISPRRLIDLIKRKTKIKKAYFTEIIEIVQNKDGKNKMIISLIITTALSYIIFPFSLYFFFKGMNISLSPVQTFVVFWLPMILGRISGIPGGYGIREGSMIYLMTKMGIPIATATSSTILYRVLTITIIMIIGILLATKYGINIFKLKKLFKENTFKEENKPLG
ncbi:flippase-like domain-containing protein [Candidatus Woesearchaeota archaeon]|nr:flippase-like domain-containing protein [Candidatus Woesearchaeota archaeon]